MISEAALTLLQDRDQIKPKGGVLTPAFVMGNLLIQRLNRAGIQFRIVEEEKKAK